MPRGAIMTGAVDLVLPVAGIPDALIKYDIRMALTRAHDGLVPKDRSLDGLREIIERVRGKPRTISGYTSRVRCGAELSGGWRWRRSRPMM